MVHRILLEKMGVENYTPKFLKVVQPAGLNKETNQKGKRYLFLVPPMNINSLFATSVYRLGKRCWMVGSLVWYSPTSLQQNTSLRNTALRDIIDSGYKSCFTKSVSPRVPAQVSVPLVTILLCRLSDCWFNQQCLNLWRRNFCISPIFPIRFRMPE